MDFVALRDVAGTLDPPTLRSVRQAASEGNADAQYLLGCRYIWANLPRAGCRKWLRAAADQNHPDATYQLYDYHLSHGRKVGPKQRELLLRAAELGSLQAQRDLAVAYTWGEDGYEKNWIRARFWYRLAALGGHTESQVACGSMMVRGDGGETRRAEGLALLEAAASGSDRDDAEAAYSELIKIYDGSWGLQAEPEKAAEWRQRLAAWQAGES